MGHWTIDEWGYVRRDGCIIHNNFKYTVHKTIHDIKYGKEIIICIECNKPIRDLK